MTRLIDANALIDEVENYIERIARISKLSIGESAILTDIKAHIELMPTIDAEPIRHGKWLWLDGVRCSQCNYKLETTGLPSYCPNCGARMDKE